MIRHIAYLSTLELSRLPGVRLPVRRWARRIEPNRFKEWYVNSVLAGRPSSRYLEIGVYRGESLVEINAERRIGVDPKPLVPIGALREHDVIVAEPSDEFFANASGYGLTEASCDAALIDGLHEFQQALRDVLNTAPLMRSDGVIVLDDCNPATERAEADKHTIGGWNGDVWKVMDIIRRTQPQWRAITIDSDNGIGLIWGFDQPQRPISEEEISRTKELTFAYLEKDRGGTLGLIPPSALPSDYPGCIGATR